MYVMMPLCVCVVGCMFRCLRVYVCILSRVAHMPACLHVCVYVEYDCLPVLDGSVCAYYICPSCMGVCLFACHVWFMHACGWPPGCICMYCVAPVCVWMCVVCGYMLVCRSL